MGILESEKIGLGRFALSFFLPFLYSSFLVLRRGTLIQRIGYMVGDRRCEKPKDDGDAVQRLAVIRSK